jgi:hypothetical protein
MPEALGVAAPIGVFPLRIVTAPIGEPVGAGEIVMVNVTGCPLSAGLGETVNFAVVVVPVDGLTITLTAVEVEVANPGVPE